MKQALGLGLVCVCLMTGLARAEPADTVLLNGKIVTVDDQFKIARALAISGERISLVGSVQDARRLIGPQTQVINLKGRTVIPGLIDNHTHFIRAAEFWDREVRWDGVISRKVALGMLREKARSSKPGEWVMVLGGWSLDQFTDDQRPFTREDLDLAAPDNPVILQLIYFRIYANSKAMDAVGLKDDSPDPRGGKLGRDAAGHLNGVLDGAGSVRMVLSKLPRTGTPEHDVAQARQLLADLNKMGMTAFNDYGGRGFDPKYFEPFRTLARNHELSARVFHAYWLQPESPQDVDPVIEKIRAMKPFQGDNYFDHIGYGETVYFPLHDNLLAAKTTVSPGQMREWRRIAEAVAERGMHLNVHATLRASIEAFLTEIEAINAVKPIKGLRWTFSHLDQVEPKDIERMRRLGMYAQIHSRPTIQGKILLDVHGERSLDMPPLKWVQDSGIPWGLGSDATAVTPSNPFYTLWWATTGEMLGGRKVGRQTITREQALIAHTRSNAYFMFQEANLGMLAPGKLADLLVLNRDYMTVPLREIKDIQPLLTMVGGKTVYRAASFK
jgi:predicted amidohydrolase YtcJ